MEFTKKVKAGGMAAVGGAVAVVMVVHPVTVLAKCTCVLVGGVLGVLITEPLQQEVENLNAKVAGLNVVVEVLAARVVQASGASGLTS